MVISKEDTDVWERFKATLMNCNLVSMGTELERFSGQDGVARCITQTRDV